MGTGRGDTRRNNFWWLRSDDASGWRELVNLPPSTVGAALARVVT
ncbi:MAG: hypothetical protein ACRDTH_28010 [Pseudonocardiaceae bacterium]